MKLELRCYSSNLYLLVNITLQFHISIHILTYYIHLSNKIHKDTKTIPWDNKLHGHCPRFGGTVFSSTFKFVLEAHQFLILQIR